MLMLLIIFLIIVPVSALNQGIVSITELVTKLNDKATNIPSLLRILVKLFGIINNSLAADFKPIIYSKRGGSLMATKKAYCDCLEAIKPVRDTLDVINGKWKLPIVISVGVGNERFTDIPDSVPGITPKVLAKELKELEQHKLLKRLIIDDYPVKISY